MICDLVWIKHYVCEAYMIKISRISSPLKDKIKNIDLCSQLDGDGSFEGNYKTTGTVLLRNSF